MGWIEQLIRKDSGEDEGARRQRRALFLDNAFVPQLTPFADLHLTPKVCRLFRYLAKFIEAADCSAGDRFHKDLNLLAEDQLSSKHPFCSFWESSMDRVNRLTERQKDCLRLVGEGFTSKEIARALGISAATVDNHMRAALEILQVAGRAEAARILVSSQRLTSQAADIAEPAKPTAFNSSAEQRGQSWFHRLIPPLGGQRNTLDPDQKIFATVTVAVVSLVSVIILILAVSVLLWLTR